MALQLDFGFQIRKTHRLSSVQRLLVDQGIFDQAPSKQSLIKLIEDGTLDGKISPFGYYIVFEDSLKAWVRDVQRSAVA